MTSTIDTLITSIKEASVLADRRLQCAKMSLACNGEDNLDEEQEEGQQEAVTEFPPATVEIYPQVLRALEASACVKEAKEKLLSSFQAGTLTAREITDVLQLARDGFWSAAAADVTGINGAARNLKGRIKELQRELKLEKREHSMTALTLKGREMELAAVRKSIGTLRAAFTAVQHARAGAGANLLEASTAPSTSTAVAVHHAPCP